MKKNKKAMVGWQLALLILALVFLGVWIVSAFFSTEKTFDVVEIIRSSLFA